MDGEDAEIAQRSNLGAALLTALGIATFWHLVGRRQGGRRVTLQLFIVPRKGKLLCPTFKQAVLTRKHRDSPPLTRFEG